MFVHFVLIPECRALLNSRPRVAREAYEWPAPKQYLQSPVDDLESFYWVGLWVALRNKTVDTAKLTDDEIKWRGLVRGTTMEWTGSASEIGESSKLTIEPVLVFNPILQSMWDLLGEWRQSFNNNTGLIGHQFRIDTTTTFQR